VDAQERANALYAANTEGSALEQLMLRETILYHEPLNTVNPGGSEAHLVVFESRREAIFKPFNGQNGNQCSHYGQDPVDAVMHEAAAWRLAMAMGAPWDQLVPTSCLRHLPALGSGALMNRRPGAPDPAVFADARAQADAAGFWDALVGQQDRHATNFRYHAESRRLALIDHAFSFAVPGAVCNGSIFCARRRAENRHSLSPSEMNALDVLISSGDLHQLRGYIVDTRADALERRATEMRSSGILSLPGAF
jgi:hypothetical protein